MTKTELEKKKRQTWAEVEKDYGLHIPPKARREAEKLFFDGRCDEEDEWKEFESCLPDYIPLMEACLLSGVKRTTSQQSEGEAEVRRKYQKSFERRLHLVSFVADCTLNLNNWADGTLKPDERIKWKKICAEWNRKCPYDSMSLNVLKVEYYRGRNEKDIQREYYSRKYEEWRPAFEQLACQFGQLGRQIEESMRPLCESLYKIGKLWAKAVKTIDPSLDPSHFRVSDLLQRLVSILWEIKKQKEVKDDETDRNSTEVRYQ